MNPTFRHLSVRMWLTAFIGGLIAISLLPWWQRAMGVERLFIPAVIILMGCFAGAGWGMNRIGLGFLRRHVNDATAWERAGMSAEAELAFRKAMATFDSFWLSPLLRRGKLEWFSAVMARFYLGRQSSSLFIRGLVAAHLKHFPGDADVAEPWLEQLLVFERHLPIEHEAVAGVGEIFAGRQQIQRLLMQFYLANGRIDFSAQQTYRRVWHGQQSLPKDTLQRLARVLRSECYLNHWALQVYLEAYGSGDKCAVEGIAAAVRWLPLTEENRAHLDAAKTILEGLNLESVEDPDPRFRPVQAPPSHTPHTVRQKKRSAFSLNKALAKQGQVVARGWNGLADGLMKLFSNRRLLRNLAMVSVGLVVVGVILFSGRRLFQGEPDTPVVQETVVKVEQAEEVVAVTDPFTIQVAAYLKSEDAQRYVDELRQKELDAFWTQVTNAKRRTWYQVKVSHFADRVGAQAYGQELKSKGLIDDYYVANYNHKQRNDIKK